MVLLATKERRRSLVCQQPNYCLPQSTPLAFQHLYIPHVQHIIQNMLILPWNTKSPSISKHNLISLRTNKVNPIKTVTTGLRHILFPAGQIQQIQFPWPSQSHHPWFCSPGGLPCLLGLYGHLWDNHWRRCSPESAGFSSPLLTGTNSIASGPP